MIARLIRSFTYRGLRLLTAASHEFQRNLTPLGQYLFALSGAALLYGVDTRQSLAYQLFSLLTALFVVAGGALLVNRLRLRRLPTLCAELPRIATVGQAFDYPINLHNPHPRPLALLALDQRLPDPRPSRQRFLTTPAPDEGQAFAFDRLLGYPRWRYLVSIGSGAVSGTPADLPLLAPGGRARVDLHLTPLRRGYLHLQHWELLFDEPLGLLTGRRRLGKGGRVLVLPKRYPVGPIVLPGSRHYQPGGITQAAAVGESQEFVGLRDYRPGDSPRHIHWRSWARSGKPQVREYQDEFFTRHALLLDTFAAEGPDAEATFECAVSVACSLIEPLSGGDALLDLLFIGTEAYQFTSGRGQLDPLHLHELLACAEVCRCAPFRQLEELVMHQSAALSGVVLVLLAWDEARQALVRRLRLHGVPLRVALVGCQAEGTGLYPIALADPASGLARLARGEG